MVNETTIDNKEEHKSSLTIGIQNNRIIILFDKDISWVALTKQQALQFSDFLKSESLKLQD